MKGNTVNRKCKIFKSKIISHTTKSNNLGGAN